MSSVIASSSPAASTSVRAHGTVQTRPVSRRRRMARLLPAALAVSLLAAGCSTGPGSEEEFVNVLLEGGTLTEAEAACIAGAVFDEYEEDDDALGKISAAPDFAFLSTEDGVDGFSEFFDRTVADCAAVGPTQSN